ncbi:MAG: hypothetical protein AAB624_03185 [Patescibacteria group bacterium]
MKKRMSFYSKIRKGAIDGRYSTIALVLAVLIFALSITGRTADIHWMKIVGYCLAGLLAVSIWWFGLRPESMGAYYKELRRKAIERKYVHRAPVFAAVALLLAVSSAGDVPRPGWVTAVQWCLFAIFLGISYWISYQHDQKGKSKPR